MKKKAFGVKGGHVSRYSVKNKERNGKMLEHRKVTERVTWDMMQRTVYY